MRGDLEDAYGRGLQMYAKEGEMVKFVFLDDSVQKDPGADV